MTATNDNYPLANIPPTTDEQIAAMLSAYGDGLIFHGRHVPGLIARVRADAEEMAALRSRLMMLSSALVRIESSADHDNPNFDVYQYAEQCTVRATAALNSDDRALADLWRMLLVEHEILENLLTLGNVPSDWKRLWEAVEAARKATEG